MFKLHTKKIYIKFDEIGIFEKSPHENYHAEKKSWAEWSGISVIQQKHALTWPGLYRLVFQPLFDTCLISPRWEIDDTVNFRDFRKLFTNKFSAFLGILAPYFQTGKTKRSGRAHEACCNDHQSINQSINQTLYISLSINVSLKIYKIRRLSRW